MEYLELKNTIIEIKDSSHGLNSVLETGEEGINKLEKNIKNDARRVKRKDKKRMHN